MTFVFLTSQAVGQSNCDPSVLTKNKRAEVKTKSEKLATLYLHWQLQRTHLLVLEDTSVVFGKNLQQAFNQNNKVAATNAINNYYQLIKDPKESLEQLNTLNELIPLVKMVYSYYCGSLTFLDKLKLKIETADDINSIRKEIGKMFLDESPKDRIKMQKIGIELKRLDKVYGFSKMKFK